MYKKGKKRVASSSWSTSSDSSEDEFELIQQQLKLLSDKVSRLKRKKKSKKQRIQLLDSESSDSEAQDKNVSVPTPPLVDYELSENENERVEEAPILASTLAPTNADIESDILSLLGENTKSQKDVSDDINEKLSPIWFQILQSGLDAETKNKLGKKYPSANLSLTAAPKLNAEIVSVLTEQHRQRDQRLSGLQNQLGAGITAVAKALTILLREKGEGGNRDLIELLGDAGRLFCDVHHENSCCRRTLVSSDIDKQFRSTLIDQSVDGWLFGSNLSERVKAARDLEKISSDLKPKTTNVALNARGLPRVPYRGYRGGPRIPQKQQSHRGRSLRGEFRQVPRQLHRSQQSKPYRQPQTRQQ